MDGLGKELDAEIEQRVQALAEAARQAEKTTRQAMGPDGELQKHREAVQRLSAAEGLPGAAGVVSPQIADDAESQRLHLTQLGGNGRSEPPGSDERDFHRLSAGRPFSERIDQYWMHARPSHREMG